jgi:hypothetical protein
MVVRELLVRETVVVVLKPRAVKQAAAVVLALPVLRAFQTAVRLVERACHRLSPEPLWPMRAGVARVVTTQAVPALAVRVAAVPAVLVRVLPLGTVRTVAAAVVAVVRRTLESRHRAGTAATVCA